MAAESIRTPDTSQGTNYYIHPAGGLASSAGKIILKTFHLLPAQSKRSGIPCKITVARFVAVHYFFGFAFCLLPAMNQTGYGIFNFISYFRCISHESFSCCSTAVGSK